MSFVVGAGGIILSVTMLDELLRVVLITSRLPSCFMLAERIFAVALKSANKYVLRPRSLRAVVVLWLAELSVEMLLPVVTL